MTQCNDVLRLVGLLFIICFVLGIGPGYTAIRNVLLDGQVFHDLCVTLEPCEEQKHALARTVNLAFVLVNATALLNGILVDALKPRAAAVFATVVWAVCVCLLGVAPTSGLAFSVGFVGFNLVGVTLFLCIIGDFAHDLLPSWGALPRSLLTGFWDLGAVTFVLVSAMYTSVDASSRASMSVLFLTLSVLLGTLTLVFLVVCYPPGVLDCRQPVLDIKSGQADEVVPDAEYHRIDQVVGSVQTVDQPTAAAAQVATVPSPWWLVRKLDALRRDIVRYVRHSLYWLYMLNAFSVIAYGYLWLPLVMDHMQWRGADAAEAARYNVVFSWLLPLFGCGISIVAGLVVKFDRPSTLASVFWLQAALATVATVLAVVPGPMPLQYGTFMAVIAWRMNGYVIINSSLAAVFPHLPSVGTALSLLYTLGGVAGLVVDQALFALIAQDKAWFWVAHLALGVFSVLVATVTALVLPAKLDEHSRCIDFDAS